MNKLICVGLMLFVIWNANAKTKSQPSSSKNPAVLIDPVDVNEQNLPRFPGGEKAFHLFLKKNLKWPKNTPDIQGKVFVSFIIEKDGRVTNPKIVRGLYQSVDEEALRVIKKSPKWIPLIQDGHPKRTTYIVPISFQLKY